MVKLTLLLACAALACLALCYRVDAAAYVEEFDREPEAVLPYADSELQTDESDDAIYEPEVDSEEDRVPEDSDDELPEDFDDVIDPEVDESEVSPPRGFLSWSHHFHYHHGDDYHYHHDDEHHHFHHHDHDHGDESKGTCSCSGDACDCCATNHNFHVHVNGKEVVISACVNVLYQGTDKYDVSVTINDHKLASNRTCSLDHAPSLCFKVPGFERVTSCVEFYDVSNKHACVKLSGKVKVAFFHTSIDLQLGCFTIPGK